MSDLTLRAMPTWMGPRWVIASAPPPTDAEAQAGATITIRDFPPRMLTALVERGEDRVTNTVEDAAEFERRRHS